MKVNVQTVHFDADAKLLEHIEKKIEKLTQFHDKIVHTKVYLKLDNLVHHIKDKTAEIKVSVPRHEFFVKHTSKSFEESFDEALHAIIIQLQKQKQRVAA